MKIVKKYNRMIYNLATTLFNLKESHIVLYRESHSDIAVNSYVAAHRTIACVNTT